MLHYTWHHQKNYNHHHTVNTFSARDVRFWKVINRCRSQEGAPMTGFMSHNPWALIMAHRCDVNVHTKHIKRNWLFALFYLSGCFLLSIKRGLWIIDDQHRGVFYTRSWKAAAEVSKIRVFRKIIFIFCFGEGKFGSVLNLSFLGFLY